MFRVSASHIDHIRLDEKESELDEAQHVEISDAQGHARWYPKRMMSHAFKYQFDKAGRAEI